MFHIFTLSFAAEVDCLLCPQMSKTTQAKKPEQKFRDFNRFPETETCTVVRQAPLGRGELLIRLTKTRYAKLSNMELKLFPDFKIPLLLPWPLNLS